MAVKSLSPLMNIVLISGLEHWHAFSFAEVSRLLCDESFISPAYCASSSGFCLLFLHFLFLLNDTSYLLHVFVSSIVELELQI